jgi:hypothetical protein
MKTWTALWPLALMASCAVVAACTSSTSTPPLVIPDSGNEASAVAGMDAAQTEAGAPTPDGGYMAESGFTLTQAPAVDPNSLANGTLLLTASGEILALDGYNFPAINPGDGVFADGWEVRFSHYIATFDKVSLWTNPDTSPTDQSKVGQLVAELDGPWAVDLHSNGAAFPYIDGKEQGERAVAFAVLANENKNGNAALPTDGTRLAVGFSAVVPTAKALNVNLDADGLGYYQYMVENGCTVLYVGQAIWKGNVSPGLCVAPGQATDAGGVGDAGFGGIGQEPEFSLLPQTVNFDLCFKPADSGGLKPGDPETSWINCDNSDNDPAPGLNGEPHERGIAFTSSTYAIGEVTFHTDHPFWESTKHDTPARFDQFAAQLVGVTADGGVPTAHLTDVIGVDYTGFKDKAGNVLPWRTCDPGYQNPNGGSRSGQMNFDPVHVPHCTGGDHSTGLCDYYDFSKYDQSTQGHWNGSDGLCFVERHYPSPP